MSEEEKYEEHGDFKVACLKEKLRTIAILKIIWLSIMPEDIIWITRLASLEKKLRRLNHESQSPYRIEEYFKPS